MITFIVAAHHQGTVAALRESVLAPLMPKTRAMSYDRLFSADRLMRGTYVFTDMERLAPSELRLASHYYRRLETIRGMRVLNDPARVKTRFALLRALREAHVNDFDAYQADSMPRPRRFPVFLRIAAEHGMRHLATWSTASMSSTNAFSRLWKPASLAGGSGDRVLRRARSARILRTACLLQDRRPDYTVDDPH
ncbi:MAG: hypothetical protein H6893_00915 [Brucellaceae bacterium]|nr:hypothetical protein [Brucellaceae bacterium]